MTIYHEQLQNLQEDVQEIAPLNIGAEDLPQDQQMAILISHADVEFQIRKTADLFDSFIKELVLSNERLYEYKKLVEYFNVLAREGCQIRPAHEQTEGDR